MLVILPSVLLIHIHLIIAIFSSNNIIIVRTFANIIYVITVATCKASILLLLPSLPVVSSGIDQSQQPLQDQQ